MNSSKKSEKEKVLIYFGSGTDIFPLELGINANDTTYFKRMKFKYKNGWSYWSEEIIKVLDNVRVFIYVDKIPNSAMSYLTVDHFILYLDVKLRKKFLPACEVKFVNHDKDQNLLVWRISECTFMFFYNTDWKDFKKVYKVKTQKYCPTSIEEIDVMYIKGYLDDEMLYELPSIKTIITNCDQIVKEKPEEEQKIVMKGKISIIWVNKL